jgi:5'-nucleotidase
MRAALVAAGHNVTLAAPLADQSGSSFALDNTPLAVKKQADRQYSVAMWPDGIVSAKPSNSALVAIGIAQESGRSPDLLISGINTSANIGAPALLSGTVGAVIQAIAPVLNGQVPAIAVGTDLPSCDSLCQQAHYATVADFIVRFVAYLQTKPGFLASEEGLLPAGVGLIISYPTSDAVNGIKVAVQSDGYLSNGVRVSGSILCASTGCSGLAVGATQRARMVMGADTAPEVKGSDIEFYSAGYVTIVPIVADITAKNPLVLKSVLSAFAP